MELDPKGLEAAMTAYGLDVVVDGLEAAIRAYIEAAPSPSPALGVVEPKIAVLPNGTGVCFGGRWNGWQFRKHPDGWWVSEMPLEMVDPMEGSPLASLFQPAKDEREVPSNCAPAQDDGVHIHTAPANPAQVTERTLSGETVNGIPVLAWMWEEELPGGDTAHSVAFHWSTPPSYAKKITRLADVDALTAATGAGGHAVAMQLDPDMPAQEMRLHMGEMTAQEMRTARAAIRWANSALSQHHPADERVVDALREALKEIDNVTGISDQDANCLGCAENLIRQALSALAQEGRKNG